VAIDIKEQPKIHRVAKELAASPAFLMARLGFGFKAKAIARLEELGYEVYDYSLLAILAEGARQTQATIAESLAVDPSRLVALLDTLEERGLIVRQRDPLDRRRHVVSITPDGEKELTRLRKVVRSIEEEFLAPLDADERKTLHELLTRIACVSDPRCAYVAAQEIKKA
jgi:MarR family transcriptional regulator, lower aerobic nicotinate degradation pathway regulator